MKADWGTGAWLRGTPGPEIIKELTPQPGDVVVEGKKDAGCIPLHRP